MCSHACKCKNDTVESVPGMGEGGIKDNGRNSEFKYGIFVVL
jgi:hypothetical protein